MQSILILVDSGATLSAVRSKENVGTPTSHVVTTVGVSGAPLDEAMAEPANFSVVGTEVQRSFIITEGSPVSLLAWDAQIECKHSLYS